MSDKTIVLITGANRGIGKALVSFYLSQPSTTVIAGVRDPSRAQSLSALPKDAASTLFTVQLDVASDASVAAAIKELQATHGLSHLDIVISNAGIGTAHAPLSSASVAALAEHVEVNAYGALRLFQQTLPLLKGSTRTPKFAVVSSPVGSFALVERLAKLPMGVYGASKALVNFLVKRLAVEEEGVASWCIHPGYVETDMAAAAEKVIGSFGAKPISPEQSAADIAKVITEATKDKTSGRFISHEGQELPW